MESSVNPQWENGYTKIATEIFEALSRIRIPGEARQILDTIIRKTWGWNKKEDIISLSQFQEYTGLNKMHVYRAINKLIEMNLIIKKGNGKQSAYMFNKYYDTWKSLPKKDKTYIRQSSLKSFCYICNYNIVLHKHHIISIKDGGTHKVENIIVVCPNCHALIHKGKYDKDFLITKKDNIEKNITQKGIITKKGNEELQIVQKILPKKEHTIYNNTKTNKKEHIFCLFRKDDKKDFKQKFKLAYTAWNNEEIVVHRKPTKDMVDEYRKWYKQGIGVGMAIKCYGEVLRHPATFFKYEWTFSEFLKRGVRKFLDKTPDQAVENFLKKRDNEH